MNETKNNFTRKTSEFKTFCSSNIIKKDDSISNQYHHLYLARLSSLKYPLEKKAEEKWGKNLKFSKLSDLIISEHSIVIGILYKQMKNKFRPLDCFDSFNKKIEKLKNFCSSNDVLYLEDTTGRIVLEGINPDEWSTGFVIALKGKLLKNSKFLVQSFTLSGITLQTPILNKQEKKYLGIISGLEIYDEESDLNALINLVEFLNGTCPNKEFKKLSSEIFRLVIAGNSICPLYEDKEIDPLFDDEMSSINEKSNLINIVDSIFSKISENLPINVMAGLNDPTTTFFPLPKLPKCLFEISKNSKNFFLSENPFEFTCDGVKFVGTSGENINDIMAHTKLKRMEAIKKTLQNRAIYPTCPDTLNTVSTAHKDLMVLEKAPNVYFCGGGDRLEKNILKDCLSENKTLLISIPSFKITKSLVLVEISSLECFEIKF